MKYKRTRGRRWLRLRHVVLVEEPVCMICGRKPSTQVDHIKPVTDGGTDERSNLQGTCDDCHDIKTRKDLGLKDKPAKIGLDGYPMIGASGGFVTNPMLLKDGEMIKAVEISIVNLNIYIGLQCFVTKVFSMTYGNRQPNHFFGKPDFR